MEAPAQVLLQVTTVLAAGLALIFLVQYVTLEQNLTTLYSVDYVANEIISTIIQTVRRCYDSGVSSNASVEIKYILELNKNLKFRIEDDGNRGILSIENFSIKIGDERITRKDYILPKKINNLNIVYYQGSGYCGRITIEAKYISQNEIRIKVSAE